MKKITNENGQTIEISDEKYNELFPKPIKNWRAKEGATYWLINEGGNVGQSYEMGDKIDDYRYHSLNYFQTEEEAEPSKKLKLAIGKVTRAINELNGNWAADWGNKDQDKYYIYFNHGDKTLSWSSTCVCQYPSNIPYTASKKIAEKIIEDYKAELELILGVI